MGPEITLVTSYKYVYVKVLEGERERSTFTNCFRT